ncbi:5-carboxymethyl-2-hydroxymuconate Delta-isomerase [Oceanihabitans sp. 2_MG-2023]|uniref:5-carboxymethyl-2-hydroxymuconate Delta-isomerase n=1 Tax=Oceanihabitans sp. 2_MG-2023 TaxID=3062661 RepID=UPI0026E1F00A|nr:5-carboxymethyl-2-hydroxymuconate Delta-isomerase [Oceanihabitans sp. 2_MG-2023]MDO6595957.1 5-carboxymethyl-2-hydroxymuconate Delta-isomerase [Oceanihabitans sp. 2_MG-2023]
MPHFVIDCSEDVLNKIDAKSVLSKVHETANNSMLFDEADIKVRLNPFKENYLVGGKEAPFIHVFANIMEGRTTNQKAKLSKGIVAQLKTMFPEIPFIAINIRDFEKATYCNKSMV